MHWQYSQKMCCPRPSVHHLGFANCHGFKAVFKLFDKLFHSQRCIFPCKDISTQIEIKRSHIGSQHWTKLNIWAIWNYGHKRENSHSPRDYRKQREITLQENHSRDAVEIPSLDSGGYRSMRPRFEFWLS